MPVNKVWVQWESVSQKIRWKIPRINLCPPHSCAHTHIHTCMLTHLYISVHAHTPAYTHICTHTHAYTYACWQLVCRHVCSHTRTHISVHTTVHTHACTHKHFRDLSGFLKCSCLHFIYFLVHLPIYACVLICTHMAMLCVWVGGGKRNFRELDFSFHCLSSGDQTQDSGRQACRQVA